VPASAWPQIKTRLLEETAKIKVGPSEEWENFMGPVMFVSDTPFSDKVVLNANGFLSGKPGFDKIVGYIEKAKNEGSEVLCGGSSDGSKGYFIQPTIILTKDPKSITMREEIFGPVMTVSITKVQTKVMKLRLNNIN
jgi:1-pyrroline-5-carboxylate dehydrogenase